MCHQDHSDISLNRRDLLRNGAIGALTLVGLGQTMEGILYAQAATPVSTPALTEGPYWIDETGLSFQRSNLRPNIDNTSPQDGLLLRLGLTVSQLNNGVVTPLKDAFVYLWHCNGTGSYSGEEANNTTGETWLRGYQITNSHGSVAFTSIYPGWYSGRTVHIHVRVRTYPNNDPTQTPTYDFESQMFFDDAITTQIFNRVAPYSSRPNRDTTNKTDTIYLGGSLDANGVTSNAGALNTVRLSDNKTYAVGTFPLILNLALAEPTGNNGGGPGGPPPGGGGPGGPPPGGGGPGGPPPGP